MKVTFEFDTSSEDFYECNDNEKLYRMQTADDMAFCISAIKDQLRTWYKHDNRSAIPTEEIEDTLMNIINEHVNLEKMGY